MCKTSHSKGQELVAQRSARVQPARPWGLPNHERLPHLPP